MAFGGIDPLEVMNAVCNSISVSTADEITFDMTEKRSESYEIRLHIRVRREQMDVEREPL